MPAISDDTLTSAHELDRGDTTRLPELIAEVEQEITDLGGWLTQARANEENVLAIWEGQSEDGRKWGKNYGREVFPWEGSSDTRVRLTDAAVDELTMLQMTAFFSANLRAMAMEANDVDAAGRVQTLLNYEVKQRLYSELWREFNFAVQWKECFGHSLVHVGWRRSWTTGKETVTEEDLAGMLAEKGLMEVEAAQPPVPDENGQPQPAPVDEETAVLIYQRSLAEVLDDIEARGELGTVEALLAEKYPVLSEKRVKQILKDLRAEGVAEFRLPVEKAGRPCVRALTPGIDVVYPNWVDDVTESPWVAMVCRLSEPELRAKVQTDGWNEDFVHEMLEAGPGAVIETGALIKNLSAQVNKVFNRGARNSFTTRVQNAEKGCYEYLHIYVKTVDEDGYMAMQEIAMHPDISSAEKRRDGKPLLGFDRMVDYYHEGGCFVDFRREYKTRSLWEARGVPELSNSPQEEVKVLRDSRMDRTSLATLPPLKVSPRRIAGGNSKFDLKPGMKVPNGQGDDTDFMRVPPQDTGNNEIEMSVRRDVSNLLGLENAELPQGKGTAHRQWIVSGFLVQAREVLLRILSLDQQFMSPMQVSRVIGGGPMPFQLTREEIAGQYDIMLSFDVRTMDQDYVTKRFQAIKEAFSLDRSGVLNDVAVTRWIIASIDPNLADIAVADAQAKMQQEEDEEKANVSMMSTGIEPPLKEGQNAQVRMQVLQTQTDPNMNPKVGFQYQGDEQFRALVDNRMKHFQFQLTQQQNAVIGRMGTDAVLPG
jgi:hypothetical protein